MKSKKFLPPLVLVTLLAGLSVNQASAQTLTKADNTTSLNFAASWTENATSTSSTTLIIDNTLTASRTAGVASDMSALGIQMNAVPVSTVARAFTLSGGTGILTIFGGGVTKAANTSALTFSNTIALGANQTWTINASTGTGTGNLVLNTPSITDNGFTLEIAGAGRLDFTANGTVNLTNNVNLNTAQVVVNATTATVNLGNASQTDNFQIIKGRAIGSTLGNFGVASSFGDGGTNTAITMGGGTLGTDNGFFEYTGANASSNRTFNFDRRSTGSEIRNTNASSTLTLTGNIQNNQGTGVIDSAYSFGGDGNITLTGDQQLKDNTNAGNVTSLNKNGNGTLTITGNNSNTNTTTGTYQGATNINAGTLIVSGTGAINSTSGINVASSATFQYDSSTALTKNVTVNGAMLIDGVVSSTLTLASDSRIGGNGTVNGNLTLGSGVDFVFSLTETLTVNGTVTLDNTFGVASLVNANGTAVNWAGVAEGTYTLIANGGNFSNILNFGIGNAASLGGGKLAYFQNGSLQLVVIPEPSTFALAVLAGIGAFASARRRRQQP